MFYQITISILFVTLFNGALSSRPSLTFTCPQNQTFQALGEDCKNCELYSKNINSICFPLAIPKCYCNKNYIRVSSTNRSCILEEDCPSSCDKNEVPVQCVNPCQASCRDVNRLPCPVLLCRRGCHCKPGYVRQDYTKKCVPISECKNPLCSDKNEFYSKLCGCETIETCQLKPTHCPLICRYDCFCQRGYLKNQVTGKCVKKEECPKK